MELGKTGATLFGASLFAGVLFYQGIDPEGMVIDALVDVLFEVATPEFRWVAAIFAVLIVVMGLLGNIESVMEVITAGGITLATAACGFIGGFTVVPLPNVGAMLIILGIFLAAITPE